MNVRRKASILSHLLHAEIAYRFKRANEYATCLPFRLAGYIHAEISSVDGVHVCVPGWTEQHLIARRWPAMRVRGRIGRDIVRAEIGLDLDNTPDDWARAGCGNQQFPEQSRGHMLGASLEKRAFHQAAGGCRDPRRLILFRYHFCCLFHSLMSARTSSAWPSGLTLGNTCSSFWSGPMTKVVRSIPMTFLPYMFFSFKTPN